MQVNFTMVGNYFLALVILPLVMAGILTGLGKLTQQCLVNDFGNHSQMSFGGVGVFIHELSHLLMAIIFFHKIIGVKLLPWHTSDRTLGYVKHSWHPGNVYQSLGNFFIGIAPCIGSSLVLWLLHVYFWGMSSFYTTNASSFTQQIKIASQNVFQPFGAFSWQWIVFLIAVILVSSTGYGLSKPDWMNVVSGTPYWCVIVLVLSVLSQITTQTPSFLPNLNVLWITLTLWGCIYLAVTLVVLYLVDFIKRI